MLARPGCRLALLGLGLALLGLLSGVVLELVVRGATGTVLPALRATHGARHNLTVSSPHRPPEAAVSQREIRLADPSFRPLHPPSPPPPPPPPPSNPKLPEGPVPGLDEPGGTRRQVGRHEWSPAVTAFVHFQGQGRDEAAVTHAHAAAGDDAEWRRAFDDAARLAGAAPPPDARRSALSLSWLRVRYLWMRSRARVERRSIVRRTSVVFDSSADAKASSARCEKATCWLASLSSLSVEFQRQGADTFQKSMWAAAPTAIPDSWRRSGGAALADAIKKASSTTKQAYVWKSDGVDEQMDFSEAHANTDNLCAARVPQFCVAPVPLLTNHHAALRSAAVLRAAAIASSKLTSVGDDTAVSVGLILGRTAALPL